MSVARSCERLESALRVWDPSDVAACAEACRLLKEAVAELEIVKAGVKDRLLPEVDVRELTVLKAHAGRMSRLLDTTHAFFPGLAGFVRPEFEDGDRAVCSRA